MADLTFPIFPISSHMGTRGLSHFSHPPYRGGGKWENGMGSADGKPLTTEACPWVKTPGGDMPGKTLTTMDTAPPVLFCPLCAKPAKPNSASRVRAREGASGGGGGSKLKTGSLWTPPTLSRREKIASLDYVFKRLPKSKPLKTSTRPWH